MKECLFIEGMLRFKPTAKGVREESKPDEEKETLAQRVIHKKGEDEHYRFD